jgi:hypothetical protein
MAAEAYPRYFMRIRPTQIVINRLAARGREATGRVRNLDRRVSLIDPVMPLVPIYAGGAG